MTQAVSTSYINSSGQPDTADCTEITSSSTTLDSGWYVVNGEVTISSFVTVNGDVNLILADGANLTVSSSTMDKAGICVYVADAVTNSLSIYCQSAGTGELHASSSSYGPGIGTAGEDGTCGIVTFYGGNVYATGSSNGSGIGSGWRGTGGIVTINGGTVTAIGGSSNGAGIGGGYQGVGGTVIVNGGSVTATAGNSSYAGIGGQSGKDQGSLTVGGNVVVKAGNSENPTAVLNPNGETDLTSLLNGQQYFTFETVGPTPLVQKTSALVAYVDEAASFNLATTVGGGTPDYAFVLKAGTIPTGMEFAGSTISGTPAASGVATLVFTVTDSGTGADAQSEDFTYTLTVTPRPKTITYMDGAVELTGLVPAEYVEGTGATLATGATKTGYTFAGWYDNAGLTGAAVTTIGTEATDNLTFWAKWTPVAYEITYIDGDTQMDGLTPTTYTIEAAAALPETATKAGYGFYGWYDNSGLTGNAVEEIPVGQTGPKTFYAKWGMIKVSANYVDENGDSQTAQCLEIGSNTTALETGWYVVNGEVTIDGYITVSGNVKLILADGAHLEVTVPSDDSKAAITVTPGNSLTIFAQANGTGILDATGTSISAGIGGGWSQSCGAVTINGGIINATSTSGGAGIGGGYQMPGGSVTINGGIVTAIGQGAGIGGGGGSNPGAGGTVIINGGTVNATGGYSGAGIGGGSKDTSVVSQGTLTVGANVVVKAGLSSYLTDSDILPHGDGGAITLSGLRYFKIETVGPVPLTQTTSVLAAYVGEAFSQALSATVSGGTSPYSFEKTSGTLPDGLSFNDGVISGTPTDAGSATVVFSVTDSSEPTQNESFTYTITVTQPPKSITYKDGNNTINGLSPTQYTPGTATALAASATKTGYTFVNWYDNDGLAGDPVTEVSASETENKTYWAKWNLVDYTITYHNVTGSLTPATYNIETSTITLPTPEVGEGETFVGWYETSTFTGAAVTQIVQGSTGDKDFYAKITSNTPDPDPDPSGDGFIADDPEESKWSWAETVECQTASGVYQRKCEPLDQYSSTLNNSWYYVGEDLTLESLTIEGKVSLILGDGVTLTVGSAMYPGIQLTDGNTLTIYGQSGGTGALIATGGDNCAGIGGGMMMDAHICGKLNIYGGNITATGGDWAAGIGSTDFVDSTGQIYVYGGTVTAVTVSDYHGGIGG